MDGNARKGGDPCDGVDDGDAECTHAMVWNGIVDGGTTPVHDGWGGKAGRYCVGGSSW